MTYGHDALGRVTSMTDAAGVVETSYDDLGNPLSVTTTYTGLDPQTLTYTYYANGQRATLVAPGGTLTYLYNTTGQLVSLDGPAGTTTWTWLDNQWLGAQTLPNSYYTEYTYLPNGKLSTLTNRDPDGNLVSRFLDLQYRGTGDLRHVEADVPGHSGLSGVTDFSYDLRRQLTREVSTRHLLNTGAGYDFSYGYDNAGNPTSWQGTTRTFNADNQETTGASWTYDGNGNPTSYAGTTCTYDVENHLTAFGTNFTAAYRGDGLRAWHEDAWGRTYYLYDGWRPVQQLDGDGNVGYTLTFGANGLVAYGNSLSLYDWQGNTLEYWEQDGTPGVWEALPAYGAANAAYEWQHGYGRGGTELVFCTYRYLDPSKGRWVTRDPIGYGGGVGLYGYVGNGPVESVDALGLASLWIGVPEHMWVEFGDESAGHYPYDIIMRPDKHHGQRNWHTFCVARCDDPSFEAGLKEEVDPWTQHLHSGKPGIYDSPHSWLWGGMCIGWAITRWRCAHMNVEMGLNCVRPWREGRPKVFDHPGPLAPPTWWH